MITPVRSIGIGIQFNLTFRVRRGILRHSFGGITLLRSTTLGLDVRLIIESGIQKQADKMMQGHTGALVLINANSGEILACLPLLYADSNLVAEQWAHGWRTLDLRY